MLSTTKSAPCVSELRIINQPNTALASRQHAERDQPAAAVGSRKPIASAGKPGVAFGNTMVTRKT